MAKRNQRQAPVDPPLALIPLDEESEELHPNADLLRLLRQGKIPEIRSQFATFSSEILGYEPIHLLGATSLYILVWAAGASAERKERYELEPADLEALQGLLLTNQHIDGLPNASGDLGDIWERVRNQYFASVTPSPPDFLEPQKALLAGTIRLHCAYYRNPYGRAFFQRMMSYIADEFQRRQYQQDRGLSLFFDFLLRLLEAIDGRLSELRTNLIRSREGSEEEVRQLVDRLASANANAAVLYTAEPPLDVSELRVLFHHMVDAAASDLFMFTPDQLRRLSPEAFYDPIPDVDRCSLRFGDLANVSFEKLVTANPVWGRPFVRFDEKYFLFSFFTVLSFPFNIFLSVVRGDPVIQKERLERVRAKYLETECESLLRKYLPGAQVFRNLFWSDAAGKRFETDVLALIENRLLVFEAKGSILPDRVRLGNFAKSKSFLKESYGLAGIQASRLEEEIRKGPGGVDLFDGSGRKLLTLSSEKVRRFLAYSVTLDQMGTFANARRLFEEIGIIDPATFPVPPIMASELARILELLPDEIHRVHYLERRHRLYSVVHVVGDELDIFATYVMQGFGALPLDGMHLVTLLNASFYLDNYISDLHVVFPSSSTVRNTKYFDRVLQYILQRKPKDYLDLGFAIIDTPPEAQETFEDLMSDMRSKTDNVEEQIRVGSLAVARSFEPFVLAGSVYGNSPRESRNEVLTRALADAITKRGLKTGLLIGRQLGFSEYPYSVIAFLNMSDEDVESYSRLVAEQANEA